MKTIDTNLILGRPGTHGSGVAALSGLLFEMDANDVEFGLVSHLAGAVHRPQVGNALLFAAFEDQPDGKDRLVPVPVVNWAEPIEAVDWPFWTDMGVRGVRVCPGLVGPCRDEATRAALLGRLRDRGWFVQVPISPFYGSPWPGGRVADAVGLAADGPDVPVLLTGCQRGLHRELCRALAEHENLYLDVGNLSTGAAVEDLVDEGLTDRLVCGSGFGVSCITPFRDMVLCADVPEEAKTAILRYNAERMLGGRGQ